MKSEFDEYNLIKQSRNVNCKVQLTSHVMCCKRFSLLTDIYLFSFLKN